MTKNKELYLKWKKLISRLYDEKDKKDNVTDGEIIDFVENNYPDLNEDMLNILFLNAVDRSSGENCNVLSFLTSKIKDDIKNKNEKYGDYFIRNIICHIPQFSYEGQVGEENIKEVLDLSDLYINEKIKNDSQDKKNILSDLFFNFLKYPSTVLFEKMNTEMSLFNDTDVGSRIVTFISSNNWDKNDKRFDGVCKIIDTVKTNIKEDRVAEILVHASYNEHKVLFDVLCSLTNKKLIEKKIEEFSHLTDISINEISKKVAEYYAHVEKKEMMDKIDSKNNKNIKKRIF